MAGLTYNAARTQVRTGDTVGVCTSGLGSYVVRIGQGIAGLANSHITHCGIAIWIGARLMLVEMGSSGNVIKPLSQYAGSSMIVCEPPASCDMRLVDAAFDRVTEKYIPYSAGDLVRIGARLLTRRLVENENWGRDSDRNKVCSLLPAMFYSKIGGDVSGIPVLAAPAEVIAALKMRLHILRSRNV